MLLSPGLYWLWEARLKAVPFQSLSPADSGFDYRILILPFNRPEGIRFANDIPAIPRLSANA